MLWNVLYKNYETYFKKKEKEKTLRKKLQMKILML